MTMAVTALARQRLHHKAVLPFCLLVVVASWYCMAGFVAGLPSHSRRTSFRSQRRAAGVMPATATEMELAVEQGGPVVVDFYAAWCGPCQLLGPELAEVARRLGDRVTVLKVDTDLEPDLATQLGIEALPTLLFFKDGKMTPVQRIEGVVTRDMLEDLVKEHLLSTS
eukprot:TRINITY_DN86320_c0_g1_i1.p1 TRINITY_DN86320_c0_g1~~TRINITY_DN86320_c0_g1_i1.p1  ORF type:complete len:167 (+),score=35.30 TRINITY_DN86320_c0_g1_i1:27-527(+)